LSHFCLQRRTEVPPYTSTDSVQLANSSVFVGEEEISPGTFAGSIADAANAFVSFIGIVRGKLVLLPFQPREYADKLSLFGSVGTGMTNARCSRGGPLVVLGLGPTSYTGKRWFFTRTEYRLAGGRLRETRGRTIRSSRRRIESFAHAQGFDALPFTGCVIARGRRL